MSRILRTAGLFAGLATLVVTALASCATGSSTELLGGGGASAQSCDDGVFEGDTQKCYSGADGTKGVGLCKGGERTCGADGTYGECEGDVTPADEICNGEDDDCNGEVDEGDPGVGEDCMTGEPGVCALGVGTCTNGVAGCTPIGMASDEICDGLDNDCDGDTDEDDPGGGVACDTGEMGACAAGTLSCTGGELVCNQDVQPSQDVCGDAVDNDCNGTADEGCCAGGSSVVEIDFAQTVGWQSVGCCNEANYRVASGPGDTLSATFVDPTPPGSVITNVTLVAGVEHACNADPTAMQFMINGNAIGNWNSGNGPDCACGNVAVGNASFVGGAALYLKGASNTVSILHNAAGNCHEAVTSVPGSPIGTAFRVEVAYSCN